MKKESSLGCACARAANDGGGCSGNSRGAKPRGLTSSAVFWPSGLSFFTPLSLFSKFVTSRNGMLFVTSRNGTFAVGVCASALASIAEHASAGDPADGSCTLAGATSRKDSDGSTGRESKPLNCENESARRSRAGGVTAAGAAIAWRVRMLKGEAFSKSSTASPTCQTGVPMIGKHNPVANALGTGVVAKGVKRSSGRVSMNSLAGSCMGHWCLAPAASCDMEASGTAGLRST
mmetsp:Transcript_2474/g.6659  ORF Transcript_2474/g.6659 Transcript_2474/m.6659 type:complete len:233 (+) Transcript_2474:973-1671(+)